MKYKNFIFALSTISSVHAMELDLYPGSHSSACRESLRRAEEYPNLLTTIPKNMHVECLKSKGDCLNDLATPNDIPENPSDIGEKPKKFSTLSRMSFAHAMVMHFPPEKYFNEGRKSVECSTLPTVSSVLANVSDIGKKPEKNYSDVGAASSTLASLKTTINFFKYPEYSIITDSEDGEFVGILGEYFQEMEDSSVQKAPSR